MSPLKGKKRPDMIGNTYAKGHGIGRKPEQFSDEEVIEMGKDMVRFFEENEDACFLQEFAIYKKFPFKKIYVLGERKVMTEYYEMARNICAKRIAKEAGKPNGLKEGIAQRFLSNYFCDLKTTEKELKDPSAKQIASVINVIRQGYEVTEINNELSRTIAKPKVDKVR